MTRPGTSSTCIVVSDSEGPFACCHCGRAVNPAAPGTRHRNHCPHCLWSQHLDHRPGDRRCVCRGPMAPIAVWTRDDGEVALVHRCTRCGVLGSNRLAGDDDPVALAWLWRRLAAALQTLGSEGGRHEPA